MDADGEMLSSGINVSKKEANVPDFGFLNAAAPLLGSSAYPDKDSIDCNSSLINSLLFINVTYANDLLCSDLYNIKN